MVAAVAIPVLKTMLSTFLAQQLPRLAEGLYTTSKSSTTKVQGFDHLGVKGAVDTAAPAGPQTAQAAESVQQLGTGLRKVLSDLDKAGSADAQQAKAIIEGAFGTAENLKGLIDDATNQTKTANAAMEAGTGSTFHAKSTTGGNYEEVRRALVPIGESLISYLAAGKATGEAVGAQASS